MRDFKGHTGWLDQSKARYFVKLFKISNKSTVGGDYHERIPETVGI